MSIKWMLKHVLRDQAGDDDAGGGDLVLDDAAKGDADKGAGNDKGAGDDKGTVTPPPAPDWRKDIAGEDADQLKTLQRFASPKALYESYKQIRDKQAKGELKAVTAYPEKGTDAEKLAWKEANGIPKDAAGYEIEAVAKNPLMSESDKEQLVKFADYAHTNNIPKSEVGKVLGWFAANKADQAAAAKARFDAQKTDTAAELGKEWGVDYKANINRIDGMLDATIPSDQDGLKTLIRNAIASNSHFARHYDQIARQINPSGLAAPSDGGTVIDSVEKELKRLDKLMRTDKKAYFKEEKQYRTLVEQYQQSTGKQWGMPG